MSENLLIYGAGGFAREVEWLITSSPGLDFSLKGFIDDYADDSKNTLKNVFSFEQSISNYSSAYVAIAIGNPATRKKIATKLSSHQVNTMTLIHDSVQVHPSVKIDKGCIVCAGSQITVGISMGAYVHVNLNCTVGHDVVIEDYVTLSPGVHISGNVRVESGALLGTGAVVINGSADEPLVIGRECVVAAGACVTKSTDPKSLYAGVPATKKRSW